MIVKIIREIHTDFRKLWIGSMHVMARLLLILMQPPSVTMRITAILCVVSPSEEVTDNRGGCYGDSSLSKKRGYVTKRTSDYEKFVLIPTSTSGTRQKRRCFYMQPCKHTDIFGLLKLLSQNQKLREKKLDLGADQGYSRYNMQFFGFNTNRSAKAYYFRLNYDQWATVVFRLFKTKAPSFLPAGLQKGKNLS